MHHGQKFPSSQKCETRLGKLLKPQWYCPVCFWRNILDQNLLHYSPVRTWHLESFLPNHGTTGGMKQAQPTVWLYVERNKEQGVVHVACHQTSHFLACPIDKSNADTSKYHHHRHHRVAFTKHKHSLHPVPRLVEDG